MTTTLPINPPVLMRRSFWVCLTDGTVTEQPEFVSLILPPLLFLPELTAAKYLLARLWLGETESWNKYKAMPIILLLIRNFYSWLSFHSQNLHWSDHEEGAEWLEFLTDMRDNKESSLFRDDAGLNMLSVPPDNFDDFFASENMFMSCEKTLRLIVLSSPKTFSSFLAVPAESFLLRILFCSDVWSRRSEVSECSALVSAAGLTVCPALTVVPQNLSDSSIFSSGHLLFEVFSACSNSSVLSVFILLSSFIILVMS